MMMNSYGRGFGNVKNKLIIYNSRASNHICLPASVGTGGTALGLGAASLAIPPPLGPRVTITLAWGLPRWPSRPHSVLV